MNAIVIDANIVMAMLIKPGKPLDLFLDNKLSIFSPERLLYELEKHKDIIVRKSILDKTDVAGLFTFLKRRIYFIPDIEFIYFREVAKCVSPDLDDYEYFALAFFLNCPIWSNDKELKEQSVIEVFSTHELLELLR